MSARILIVDDDLDTRELLARFVTAEGHEPLLAADGESAVAMVEAGPADLVLLDAVMPGMDGFATCRRIKAGRAGAGRDLPVIFMTGLSDTQHVVMGLEAGGVDYVTKPLALDELAARIRVHLANAAATRTAMSGLAGVGAQLFSCDAAGRIGWSTPEAERLLALLGESDRAALSLQAAALAASQGEGSVTLGTGTTRLALTRLGSAGGADHLFKLERSSEGIEVFRLQEVFGLTPREADVLLWTARGKSNKDMSEILNISARTVNKHLEQIFIKIGVENRASAAAAATRALYSR